MIEIKGKYNTALVYSDNIDPLARSQIQLLCDEEAFSSSKIRMMSDVHAGKGCSIGTTMTIADKVVPSMVGVDIGCGMEVVELDDKSVDFNKLDDTIREYIPFGMNVRKECHPVNDN